MCAASARLPHLHLGHQNKFHYLNQGNNPLIDGVDDLVCFDETISALTMLGFSSKQQDDMLRILAAIIHLGNVHIGNVDNQSSNNESDTEASYIHVNITILLLRWKSISSSSILKRSVQRFFRDGYKLNILKYIQINRLQIFILYFY